MPFTQHMVRAHLNHLAKTKNILDEQGEVFHSKLISLDIPMQ